MTTICEHGEGRRQRCRRRAVWVTGYRILFGHNIGPNSSTPIYITRATWRCEAHKSTGLPGVAVGVLSLEEDRMRSAAVSSPAAG